MSILAGASKTGFGQGTFEAHADSLRELRKRRSGVARKPHKLAGFAVTFLLLIGLFFPSSVRGQISKSLELATIAFAVAFLILLNRTVFSQLRPSQLILTCLMISTLLIFTIITPTREYAFGAILPFLVVALLACLNLRSIKYTERMDRVWWIVNLVMLIAACAILVEIQGFEEFLIDWYSNFYPELLPTMLEGGKPVVTFATHSYAAYFFYLFFFMNLRRYQVTGSIVWLTLSFLFLAMLWQLRCVASSVLIAVGILQSLVALLSPKRAIVTIAAAICLVFAIVTISESWETIADTYGAVMTDPSSGLLARFGGGQLQPTLDYIAQNPFLGVGLGYSESLFFGDSGVVMMMLRGSVPLLFSFYLLIWGLFAENLPRSEAITVFAIFLAMEIGMDNLCYIRTQCFIPFLIVYLNGLALEKKSRTPHIAMGTPK